MSHQVSFRSERFDPAAEPENPINPIPGHAVLVWLCDAARSSGYTCGEPAAEDWGWCVDVSANGVSYVLGASAAWEPGQAGPIEWTVQLERPRSLRDRLFRRNVHDAHDPLSAFVERMVRNAPDATDVVVHWS
jgi:hypothetical protein